MKKPGITLILLASLLVGLQAQETFPVDGVEDHRERYYAFKNATVFVNAEKQIEDAVLIIRDGKILSIQPNSDIPKGAVVLDLSGKTVYPAFIDCYSDYGMPEIKKAPEPPNRKPQMLSDKSGAYSWNEALKTEFKAHEHFTSNAKTAKTYRALGFGLANSHQMDGISRGTSTIVALGDEQEQEMMLKETAAHHLSFQKGTSSQNYPNSLMGIIALLRQTYYDADWYQKQKGEETNISLQAWNDIQELPQIFDIRHRLEALRAGKLGREFEKKYILMGHGDEYQRLEEIKALNTTFILPLDFPDAYDVEDPYDAQQVTLAQLKHWELAPHNPAILNDAGIRFAITPYGLKKKESFLPNLRKAINSGLSEEVALKALTSVPASILGVADQVGTLEPGKWANFIITNGNVFDKDTKIYHTWIKGKPYVHKSLSTPDWIGKYDLSVGTTNYQLSIKGEEEKPEFRIIIDDSTSLKVKYDRQDQLISLSFKPESAPGKVRLSGIMDGKSWSGQGQDATGNWVEWTASYQADHKNDQKAADDKKKSPKETATSDIGSVIYPFTSYGAEDIPSQQDLLIQNAVVWTNEEAGIQEDTDILIRGGKIAAVGKNIEPTGNIKTIDASGKHITPGIIDEHSHIAISRGVNEGTQASTAEVRIGDVINSEDVNIYRQLSGGVTASQLLHGSANPIGGQSAMIKLRWGMAPEDMKFEEAAPFIKFALGENVKQSNWGDNNRTRFPQTRMGVEQMYVDYFTQAKQYGELKASGQPYRKDLDLETGLEILESKRFITCHSYRQSEINMLMKVAERFNFRLNTFTHILEGYKIADKMAAHGAGASSFSDWWAYKYEVMEAIPYNGAIMHEQGVTVAFNSDDSEMARRLNQEAAKAVLFGDVSEEDALKFVTLNPAKLLHIDQYVGSIKPGKHADLVVWSDHPLSMYTKAEQTYIDGRLYFDREEDLRKREYIANERHRLIQKMLDVKKGGGKTQKPSGKNQYQHYHCDDNHDEAK
jgi:imidazolonepropionase-like amidohydrolase